MSLDEKHPLYADYLEDWQTMRHLYQGERVVKKEGFRYLPATSGMRLDGLEKGKDGYAAYQAYTMRAPFPDYVRTGVEHLIGLLHQKPATFELPEALEPLRQSATVNGESLNMFLRRIHEEQLAVGRLGLLADLPNVTNDQHPLPYIAMYSAEAVHNWDDQGGSDSISTLNMVVLDESGFVRENGFSWVQRTKYRVLQLNDLDADAEQGLYKQGVFDQAGYNENEMIIPRYKGVALESIPFVFVNSKDVIATPDVPPLLGLGQLVLSIYRSEADYRQNLHMQGQDTLVVIGRNRAGTIEGEEEEEPLRVGAGSRVDLEIGGDAKYIGVSPNGLAEQREALENDRKRAETKAGQLINSQGTGQESGEALKTRLAAQTATLNQIALTGAAALETILKKIAIWVGANPEEVKVTANLEFTDFNLDGKELVSLVQARTMGAPISLESIHKVMMDRGLTEFDYETEMGKIAEENANSVQMGTDAGGPLTLDEGNDNADFPQNDSQGANA